MGFTYSATDQIKSKSNSNTAFDFAPTAANDNFAHNGLNQISSKNGTSFGYDARGNLTSDGVKSYVYNAENMLTSATQAGVTSILTYDAQNRIASITKSGITTKFIYDGTDLIAEYDGNNNLLRKYVHGGGIDEPLVWYEGAGLSDKRFLISDQQGSVIATTNSVGTVLNISTYSPYGERTNTNAAYASRFGYTGQADIPELNLQNYKARIYDPKLGRFLQSDPIGYDAGMNIYAYVTGDPINLVDPLGLHSWTVDRGSGCFQNMSSTETNQTDPNGNVIVSAKIRGGSTYCLPGGGFTDFALRFVTGYDLAKCGITRCDTWGWAMAVAGAIPAVKPAAAAVKGTKYGLKAARNLGNPFKNLTAKQIEKMFMKKGFSKSGTNPLKGYGGYVNPKNNRSYHIDPKSFGKYPEDNHVDVNRLKGDTSGLDKKKLPYKQD